MDFQKYRIVLPNAVTSLSILAGLFAIFFTFETPASGYYTLPCWLIIFATMLDGIDGKVARLTNSSSEFGVQYDSMADVITFGVAASVVVFKQIFVFYIVKNPAFYVFPIFFLLCGAVRLARFNCTASPKGKKGFIGLPIPVAAGSVVSLLLFFEGWDRFVAPQFGLPVLAEEVKLRMTIGYILLVSVLMVSQVKYDITFSFFLQECGKHKVRTVINLMILALAFWHPGFGFYAVSSFYIVYGLIRAAFGPSDSDDAPAVAN